MNDNIYCGNLLENDDENELSEDIFGNYNDDDIEMKNTEDTEKDDKHIYNQNYIFNKKIEDEKEYLKIFPNNNIDNDSINQSLNDMSMENLYFQQRSNNKENISISLKEELSDLNQKSYTSKNENDIKNEYIGKKRETKNNTYSPDKMRKRVRIIALKAIIYFINEKIKSFYKNIGKGLLEKQFKDIDKTNLSHSNVGYDKIFLEYKLKEIFSWNISSKITTLLKEHNKNLLGQLINSEIAGNYIKELFEMTFSQCLEHIQGKKYYEILNGLMNFEKTVDYFCDEKEKNDNIFRESFHLVFMNYQELVERKSTRKPKNSK